MNTIEKKTGCDSCAVLYINGVKCHEHGCPDAYKDYYVPCLECGNKFKPENRFQEHCDSSCYAAYYGLPEEESGFTFEDEYVIADPKQLRAIAEIAETVVSKKYKGEHNETTN